MQVLCGCIPGFKMNFSNVSKDKGWLGVFAGWLLLLYILLKTPHNNVLKSYQQCFTNLLKINKTIFPTSTFFFLTSGNLLLTKWLFPSVVTFSFFLNKDEIFGMNLFALNFVFPGRQNSRFTCNENCNVMIEKYILRMLQKSHIANEFLPHNTAVDKKEVPIGKLKSRIVAVASYI